MTDAEAAAFRREQKGRNIAMLVALSALAALFFAITIVEDGTSLNGPKPRKQRRGNLIIAGMFTAVAVGMVGLSFAAIPLYRAFCQATGYAGTPKIGPAAAPGGDGQTIRVRFNADVNPGIPWTFSPDQLEIAVPLGEDHLASYTAA